MGTSTDAYLAFGINFDEDDLEYQLMESKTLNEQQKNIITLYLDENGGIDENLLLILFLEGGGVCRKSRKKQ